MNRTTITWLLAGVVVLVIAALFLVGLAGAQEVIVDSEPVVDERSWLYGVWTVVQPIVVVLMTAIAPVIAALVTGLLVKLFNLAGINDENARLSLEAKLRTALHEAAINAVKYAVARKVGLPDMITGAVPKEVIDVAIEYIRSKNPDTAKALGVNDADLTQIILSKIVDVQSTIDAARGTAPVATKVRSPRER